MMFSKILVWGLGIGQGICVATGKIELCVAIGCIVSLALMLSDRND